jgi:hypothetical protein
MVEKCLSRRNRGKHSCSSRCQSMGLRWFGWTQEHKNHREDAMVYPDLGQSMPYVQQLMILIPENTKNGGGLQQSVERDLVGG